MAVSFLFSITVFAIVLFSACVSTTFTLWRWQLRWLSAVNLYRIESKQGNNYCITCSSLIIFADFSVCYTKDRVVRDKFLKNSVSYLAIASRMIIQIRKSKLHVLFFHVLPPYGRFQLFTSFVILYQRIWSGISAFAGTVVSGTSVTGTSPSNRPDSIRTGLSDTACSILPGEITDTGSKDLSPSYVTVVDLATLHARYLKWKKTETAAMEVILSENTSVEDQNIPAYCSGNADASTSVSLSGTNYINVHDHCEFGSLVAHFMVCPLVFLFIFVCSAHRSHPALPNTS